MESVALLHLNCTAIAKVGLPELLTVNFNYCINCRYKGQCHFAAKIEAVVWELQRPQKAYTILS